MSLEEGLRTYLLGVLPAKYIGADRVAGIVRGQGDDLPEVLITRTSTNPQVGLCGTFNLRDCDIQIDAYAMTGDDCLGLAKCLRHALIDFSGSMGETVVKRVLLTNEFPLSDPEPGVIRMVQLYNIWYLED